MLISSSSIEFELVFRFLFGDVCCTTSWCRVNIRFIFGVDSSDGSNGFDLNIKYFLFYLKRI